MGCYRLLFFLSLLTIVPGIAVNSAEQQLSETWRHPAAGREIQPLPSVSTSVPLDQMPPQPAEAQRYVTWAEYERLRSELRNLQMKIEQRQPVPLNEDYESLQSLPPVRQVAHLEPLWEYQGSPGWERARSDDWMGLGRLQRMTTLISQTCHMDLYMGHNSVGRLQYLQQKNVADTVGPSSVVPGALEPGIQTPFGQFSFLADFGGSIEVYFDIFIASRPHPEELQGNEGYMLVRQLPGPLAMVTDFVQFKAGEFEMDFGDAHYRRSNNADVQRNPLIGNYVVDPRATEIGLELFNPPNLLPVNWLIGVGFGNSGDFQNDRGWQFHAKLFGETSGRLRPAVSFFYADHSGNPTGFPNTGSKSDLFRSNRAGGPYADVLGAGNAPGQVLPGNGQQVTALQFDLTTIWEPWEFYGHFGMFQDSDTNGDAAGTPTESWLYFAGEGVYRFTPYCYLAARYSGASAQHLVSAVDTTRDVNSDGLVHRFQIGLGYWVHEFILAKFEYVHQYYQGFTPDGAQVSGVDVWRNPTFNGVLAEVSFTF